MLQALGKGQSCRRARAGPCEELEHRDGVQGVQEQRMEIRAGKGVGSGARRMQRQQPEEGMPQLGGWHLEQPGEHRQWGKLCLSPGGGGVGLGSVSAVFPEEEEAG